MHRAAIGRRRETFMNNDIQKTHPTLSVVIPIFNEAECFPGL